MPDAVDYRYYYLDNFQQVLDWIAQRYDDLLSVEERDFIATFPGLPQASRALFVRMMMRRGEFFRASKLDYPEIGEPLQAAAALPAAWLDYDPVLTLEQLFDLSTKPELVRCFSLDGTLKSARKSELLARLAQDPAHTRARAWSQWQASATDVLLHLRQQALCDRLRLMFFGNLRQDWSEFVLADLGMFRYERIAFPPQARGFRSRADIDHYLHLHACKERYHAGEAPAAILPDLLAGVPVGGYDNGWPAASIA